MAEFGPFHRKSSPTQTFADRERQLASGEIWGRAVKIGGKFPCVKAYVGALCFGLEPKADCTEAEGIEFTTVMRPTLRTPSGQVFWRQSSPPVAEMREVDDQTISLRVTLTKIVYYGQRAEVVSDGDR